MKAAHKCYLYTRVSTFMQVDGYSLDAQKDKLRKYAEFQEMQIMGEYSDEGKSGKNVEGRPEFLKMLRDSFKNCRLAIKKINAKTTLWTASPPHLCAVFWTTLSIAESWPTGAAITRRYPAPATSITS